MPENSDEFYQNLLEFDDFRDVTDRSYYRPIPDDWCIVLADIKGSTKAIEEGRYKDVNMIGAACITAVINAVPEVNIPYVFGGDGATLAVPASATASVERVMGAARRLSKNQFNLDLRVGIVPAGDIREAGAEVLVAKFRLSPGNSMAMFAGGGVQLLETLIKADEGNDQYQIPLPESDSPPDLDGLSCRWEPLKSCQGTMISMLVHATEGAGIDNGEIYREVIDGVADILKTDPKAASPVSAGNMILKWPSQGIRSESKLMAGTENHIRKRVWLYCTSFIQFILEKFDLSAGGYDAQAYRAELRASSDFRRFDDTLRMILDCTVETAGAIEAFFMELHNQGKIAFGTHRSDHALMTCLVFSLTKGEHVHFVDGSDGGFAMASVQLKAQMLAASKGPAV